MHLGRTLVAGKFLEQGVAVRTHGCVAFFDHSPEDRLLSHELTSHSPPLWSLTAQDKSDAWRVFRSRREGALDFRCRLGLRKGTQLLDRLVQGARDQRQAMLVVVAPGAERIGQIGQNRRAAIGVSLCFQPRPQAQRRGAQRSFRAGRYDDRPGACGAASGIRQPRSRRLGQNHVCVRASETERIDARHPRSAVSWKFLQLDRHADFQSLKVNVGVRVSRNAGWRESAHA